MAEDSFFSCAKTALYAVGIAAIAVNVIRYIILEYRLHKRDQAAVETYRAVVYWKDPEPKQALLGRHSSWVYYITFHTDAGDILPLYLNGETYYSLQEGDKGILTWQADRFWKFEKEE